MDDDKRLEHIYDALMQLHEKVGAVQRTCNDNNAAIQRLATEFREHDRRVVNLNSWRANIELHVRGRNGKGGLTGEVASLQAEKRFRWGAIAGISAVFSFAWNRIVELLNI